MAVEDLLNYFEDAGIELGMEDLIIIILIVTEARPRPKAQPRTL